MQMEGKKGCIMVGIDLSPGSQRALERAVDLAERLGSVLKVVHVYEPLAVAATEPTLMYADLLGQLNEERKRHLEQCEAICSRVIFGRIPYSVHVFDGMAIDGLLMAISSLKPEMIVVGTHGRGAVMRMLMGSVSTALCQKSPVPVVVVPSAERVATTEAAPRSAPADDVQKASEKPPAMAYSCANCGHILNLLTEYSKRCEHCGAEPAKWNAAPMVSGPADQLAPAVGEAVAESLPDERTQDPGGIFATSPPGAEGYDVNPELRVRY